jgi:hypothetical protein
MTSTCERVGGRLRRRENTEGMSIVHPLDLESRALEGREDLLRVESGVRQHVSVRRGVVSKGEGDGRRPPDLQGWATPETTVRPFQGWPARRA